MKNHISFALFLVALLLINLPFSLNSTSGFAETDTGSSDSSGLLNKILMSGAGVSNMIEDDPAKDAKLDLSQMIKLAIPAIDFINGETPDLNEPDPPDDSSQPVKPDYNIDVERLDYKQQYHKGKPLILIYHTHTTEAYIIEEKPKSYRSTDFDIGVVSVGKLMAQTIYEDYGIEVLHITDIFDQPYNGAYDRSYKAIQNALKKYPSIKYMFDVHRDGLNQSDTNRAAYYAKIEGNPAAKVAIVLGVKSEYTDQNTKFASLVSGKMNDMYPGLYKKLIKKEYYYNQYIIPNSILLEVGSNLTTPSEARTTATMVGKVLAEVVKNKEGSQ